MYCPNCGQQQASNEIRYCSRCGFPLEGVNQLIAGGGLPQALDQFRSRRSARYEGMRQGIMLIFLGVVLTPVAAILNNYLGLPELFIALSAAICFIGGFLRTLYALIFEEGKPKMPLPYVPPHGQLQQPRQAALPPMRNPAMGTWPSRGNTAEIVRPQSVTENTTRLLDDDASSKPS